MKKLFFAALVAVAAVGGAYAQTYIGVNTPNTQYDCSGDGQLCKEYIQEDVQLDGQGTVLSPNQLPDNEFIRL